MRRATSPRGTASRQVSAVKRQRFAAIDGNLIGRMGPRFVEGAERLCQAIAEAR